jgi:hypothetical protein
MVKITDNGGGKWYGLMKHNGFSLFTWNEAYRHLLIDGTREPFFLYGHNIERANCGQDGRTGYQCEVKNAENVFMFSGKCERAHSTRVTNSDNVAIIGFGGSTETLFDNDCENAMAGMHVSQHEGEGVGLQEVYGGVTQTLSDNNPAVLFKRGQVDIPIVTPGPVSSVEPTPTPTPPPTPTPTPTPKSTAWFSPIEDTWVADSSPGSAGGGDDDYLFINPADGYEKYAFLKFVVTGVSGPIQAADLLVYCHETQTGTNKTVQARRVTDNAWSETTLTWANMDSTYMPSYPDGFTPLGTDRTAAQGAWVEFDISAHVTGNGTFSVGLDSSSGWFKIRSKEHATASERPVLRVVTLGGPSATTRPPILMLY